MDRYKIHPPIWDFEGYLERWRAAEAYAAERGQDGFIPWQRGEKPEKPKKAEKPEEV